MPHLYFHINVCYLKKRKCNNRHYSVSILHETGEAVYTLFSNSFRNDIQISTIFKYGKLNGIHTHNAIY